MNIGYLFHSGKNSKLAYYISSYFRLLTPRFWLRFKWKYILKNVSKRSDYDLIQQRLNYYCSLENYDKETKKDWNEKFTSLSDQKVIKPKVYYLDSFTYARYFPMHLKWNLSPGDINYIPEIPSIVKSRPISKNNANAVIMKMDKVRHFVFLNDKIKWEEKKDMVIFRGAIGQKDGNEYKKNRYFFMSKYLNHTMCDIGEIAEKSFINADWVKPKISLYQHLNYKFIMSLEGNDVASNLKWVMSSNSIAVMPKPKYETWFMEGKLIPSYHYIEIKEDFSDLEEKLLFYISHPYEAKSIISHAHEFVNMFRDKEREDILSLLVLNKYFEKTNLI